jgi:pimeloyl-ACP methyl ester carboxylesterase
LSSTGTAIGIGLALSVTAFVVHENAQRAERQNPPIGNFVDADGVRLHYVRQGRGDRTVVFLHGNGSMMQELAASGLLDMLARQYTVIAFDRPGFGHSRRPQDRLWTPQNQAKVLLKALAKLSIGRPIVVGHSWGTLVALAMALDCPERVSSLVLISGYYYATARADVAAFALQAIPVLSAVTRYTISPILGGILMPRMIRKIFEPAPVPQGFEDSVPMEMTLRPSQIRASAQDTALMIPSAAALQDRYGELRLPLTIIAGSGDRIVDPRQAHRLHKAVRHSKLLVLRGQGHMVHHGASKLVAAATTAVAMEVGRV